MAPACARARSAGPSPWWRIASGARFRRSWGCPTERGLPAGQHHCGCAFGQVAVSPNRAPGAPGQVGRKIEPGAALGGPGQVTIQSASGSLSRGRWRWAGMRRRLHPKRLGRRGPGAGRFRTRAPASADPAHGVITDHDHPGRGSGPARAVLCPSDVSRAAGLERAR